jgi:DNA-binding winged helix-turn-helix (wHTH) protein/TolB-like protein
MISQVWTFNGCRFDPRDGSLSGPDGEVILRPQAARLLSRLVEQPDEIIDRDSLIEAVWDKGRVVDFESGLAALLRELRSALDRVGAGAELVETVPRRGCRFLGSVEAREEVVAQASRRMPVVLKRSAVLLVLVLVAVLAALWPLRAPPPVPVEPTLAIIPFDLYGEREGDQRRIDLLLADSVLAHLWQAELADLVLIGRATLRPYEGREDVAAAVAADLGVQLLFEGSVLAEGANDWHVNARLLAMPAGAVIWSSSVAWVDQERLPVAQTAEQLVGELAEAWPRLREEQGFRAISD